MRRGRARATVDVREARRRYAGACFFALVGRCGVAAPAALQAHRIVPGEAGGAYHWDNILVLCASCHCLVTAGVVRVLRRLKGTAGDHLEWVDEAGARHLTHENGGRHVRPARD